MTKAYVHPLEVSISVLFLVFPLSTRAEDLALRFAEGFVQEGNYQEAITEYKRFICFSQDDGEVSDTYFKMGMAYRNQAQWENALLALRKSVSLTPDDSVREARKIEIGIVDIASRDYSAAEFELLRICTFGNYESLKRKALFFLGVCHLYQSKWAEARQAFHQYFDKDQNLQYLQVDSLLTPSSCPKQKSQRFAKWCSTFIPGSGQIYAGHFWDGLNALTINLGTGYLLTSSVLDQRYQDAVIAYVSLFLRYYIGNRNNAENFANDNNSKKNKEHCRQALEQLRKSKD
jgi:tetratricopeptide (TPR) repeat protein